VPNLVALELLRVSLVPVLGAHVPNLTPARFWVVDKVLSPVKLNVLNKRVIHDLVEQERDLKLVEPILVQVPHTVGKIVVPHLFQGLISTIFVSIVFGLGLRISGRGRRGTFSATS